MKAETDLRHEVQELLAELPDGELWRVKDFLAYLRTGDRMLLTMASAPYDDEPLTPEEEAAVAEGLEDSRRGNVRSLEEVRRELGL